MDRLKATAEALATSGRDALVTVDQAVLDAIPIAAYLCASDGAIVRFNRRTADLCGRVPLAGDTSRRYWADCRFYRPDGTPLPYAETPMEAALETGERCADVELAVRRPDGSRIVVTVNVEPLTDASGAVQGAINFFQDITDRKRAEKDRQAASKFSERETSLLALIVESSDDAIVSKNLDGIILSWNKGAERLFGYSAEEAVGRSITLIIPSDRRAEEPEILDRIRRGNRITHYETVRQCKDGSLVDISLTISPVRDASGTIVGASKIARNITSRVRTYEMLARQRDEQATLFEFTSRLHRTEVPEDIYDAALDAIVRGLRCDRAAVQLIDESDRMKFVAWRGLSDRYRQTVDGRSPWATDARNLDPIVINDIESANLPLLDAVEAEGITALAFIPLMTNGRLIGKFMVYHNEHHDFTEAEIGLAVTIAHQLGFSIERIRADEVRKHTEEQRDLLVAELSHRVKNTLATVVSIARLSFSRNPNVAEARRSFDARIRALAQSHGRLAETNWSGVSFDTILADEFTPFRREDGSNLRMSGPSIVLNPQSALTLGMVVHELATNAAKFGALSTRNGMVDVAWQIDPADGQFQIRWTESDGPTVAPPAHSGFGRLLLERALTAELSGNVHMDFAESGLKCVIAMPVAHLLARYSAQRHRAW